MDMPHKITYAAERLKLGHRVNRLTVRDFLWHFGAERRGAAKVQVIRRILNSLGLITEPDFELAWIDELIWLRLKDSDAIIGSSNQDTEDIFEPALEAEKHEKESEGAALISSEPETPLWTDSADRGSISDPTFRIGSLPAANKRLVAVNNDAPLAKAVTLMMQNDFSQLPVMQGEREVKGVVSWKSIGSRLALGYEGKIGDLYTCVTH